MARKVKNVHLDRAQEKQKKQKKVLFILLPVLLLALALEVPKTMKLMNHSAKPPVISAQGAAPAATPQVTTSTPLPPQALAEHASAPAASSSAQPIIASVPVQAATGQLTEFERFASKDPFLQSVQKIGGAAASSSSSSSSSSSGQKTSTTAGSTNPKTPPAPPPSSAVISVNGELMSVDVATDFPTQGTVYSQVGAPLFHLLSLTQTTANVAIAGGSYADGAPSLTLDVGKPVTLQNTADGTRYTLILEPQGTQVPNGTTGSATTGTTPPPASTTPSVIPSSSSGG